MIIHMDDYDGESVTKVCDDETWMGILMKTVEGLRGLGYNIPKNKDKFITMLYENMEANE